MKLVFDHGERNSQIVGMVVSTVELVQFRTATAVELIHRI